MKKSYKSGLKQEDIPLCSTQDSCDHTAQRSVFAKEFSEPVGA